MKAVHSCEQSMKYNTMYNNYNVASIATSGAEKLGVQPSRCLISRPCKSPSLTELPKSVNFTIRPSLKTKMFLPAKEVKVDRKSFINYL